MRIFTIFGIAIAALATTVSAASAQSTVQVGTITCGGGQSVGYVIGSAAEFHCVFNSPGRPPEPYVAEVQRFGVDLGVVNQAGLGWTVFAPTRRIGFGDLAGSYGGVGGNASVFVGGGGNLLWGGSNNTFALQPLSLQGQAGFNVTGGVIGVQLHPVYPARRHYRRR